MPAKLVYNQTGVCTPTSILGQVVVGQPVNSSVGYSFRGKNEADLTNPIFNLTGDIEYSTVSV